MILEFENTDDFYNALQECDNFLDEVANGVMLENGIVLEDGEFCIYENEDGTKTIIPDESALWKF